MHALFPVVKSLVSLFNHYYPILSLLQHSQFSFFSCLSTISHFSPTHLPTSIVLLFRSISVHPLPTSQPPPPPSLSVHLSLQIHAQQCREVREDQRGGGGRQQGHLLLPRGRDPADRAPLRAQRPSEASLAPFHVEHEDHLFHGARRDDEGDSEGAGRQQLRVRAAGALHAAVHGRQPRPRRLRAVGDGGVQAASPLAQRRAL